MIPTECQRQRLVHRRARIRGREDRGGGSSGRKHLVGVAGRTRPHRWDGSPASTGRESVRGLVVTVFILPLGAEAVRRRSDRRRRAGRLDVEIRPRALDRQAILGRRPADALGPSENLELDVARVDDEGRRDVCAGQDLPVGLVPAGRPTAGLGAVVGIAPAAVDEREIAGCRPCGPGDRRANVGNRSLGISAEADSHVRPSPSRSRAVRDQHA